MTDRIRIVGGKRRLVLASLFFDDKQIAAIAEGLVSSAGTEEDSNQIRQNLTNDLVGMQQKSIAGEIYPLWVDMKNVNRAIGGREMEYKPYRDFAIRMFDIVTDRLVSDSEIWGDLKGFYMANYHQVLKSEFSKFNLQGYPDFADAIERNIRKLKSTISDGGLSMLMMSKLHSIIPSDVHVHISQKTYLWQALMNMIPRGTDPLHAIMYIQKKVRTIKDIRVQPPPKQPDPPRSDMVRFELNITVNMYVDVMVDVDRMRLETKVGEYIGTVVFSRPGGEKLTSVTNSYRSSTIWLSDEEDAKVWKKALDNRTMNVRAKNWNVELDRMN